MFIFTIERIQITAILLIKIIKIAKGMKTSDHNIFVLSAFTLLNKNNSTFFYK